jgi:hypothetical protein
MLLAVVIFGADVFVESNMGGHFLGSNMELTSLTLGFLNSPENLGFQPISANMSLL